MKKRHLSLVKSKTSNNRSEVTDGQHPDTDGLGWTRYRGSEVIGYVSHVNGPGAKARPEFIPTQYELEELAKLWLRTLLDHDFYFFCTQTSGSSEWREIQYAECRLGRLRQLLGKETIDRITTEALAQLGEQFAGSKWDAFLASRRQF